ncbi:hypothetical protein BJ973_008718 [Actinoplanes tereljensis]|uniref:Cytochrome P450 n=1 Tax=Paractinoplanes tereljensis TaxID=571912 RepID=A0A919TQJ1_9ACTN|nr:hypothetical protein [Actinoplanes tereljensis]GIF18321.1 hypothetical protein Ate02nite_10510 [Actinoplanes tereljensis]
MQKIDGRAALAVLTDPAFVVPPVPPGTFGIAWLRASVGRFGTGPDHDRRRALAVEIIDRIPPAALQRAGDEHPVVTLARAMGITAPVVDLVREIAQAYRPGTGDDPRADAAVESLIETLSGTHDEQTAARIGVLVQACDATAALIDRLRDRSPASVFRDDPPVAATKRQATAATALPGGHAVEAGEEVLVALAGDLAFGAGPRRCPGRAHALALAGLAPESGGLG